MRSIAILLKYVSALLLVAGSLLMAGCDAATTTAAHTAPAPTPSISPASRTSNWQAIPVPGQNLEFLGYTVSPADPETLYACTSDGGSLAQNPITLWRTHNAGQHWAALHLPTSPGTNCQIAIAPSQPQRIVVLITNPNENSRPCDKNLLYLSNDGGTSWQHIPYNSMTPQGAQTVFCGGSGEKVTLKLVAQFADACNISNPTIETLEHKLAVLKGYCDEIGRDYNSIKRTVLLNCAIADTEEAALAKSGPFQRNALPGKVREQSLIGTPAMIRERLAQYEQAGAQEVIMWMPDAAQLDAVRMFAREVIPKGF